MVEVAVCTVLVGTLLVTSLRTVGAVYRYRGENLDEQRAVFLAEVILDRIESLPYHDPDGNSILGREYFEGYFNSPFDDMNDFHNYTESPPLDSAGQAVTGYSEWSWTVVFQYVDPLTLTQVDSDQGVMRSTVSLSKNGEIISTIDTLHVNANLMELAP